MFAKIAYAQVILRSRAGEELTKEALLGAIMKPGMGLVRGAGKLVWNQAVKHNGAAAPLALAGGALAGGAAMKAGIARAKQNQIGFDPAMQAYKTEMGE